MILLEKRTPASRKDRLDSCAECGTLVMQGLVHDNPVAHQLRLVRDSKCRNVVFRKPTSFDLGFDKVFRLDDLKLSSSQLVLGNVIDQLAKDSNLEH